MNEWGAGEWVSFASVALTLAFGISRVVFWMIRSRTVGLVIAIVAAPIKAAFEKIRLTVRRAIGRYVVITERPATPTPNVIMSQAEYEAEQRSAVAPLAATDARSAVAPVATPTTPNNEALLVAQVALLAKLILASRDKPLARGVIPETWALTTGLGVKPSSTSADYLRARELLRQMLDQGARGPLYWAIDEEAGGVKIDPATHAPVKVERQPS